MRIGPKPEWADDLDPWHKVDDPEWWEFVSSTILLAGGQFDDRRAFTSQASVELMVNSC